MSINSIPDPNDVQLQAVPDVPSPLDQLAGVCPDCGGSGEIHFNPGGSGNRRDVQRDDSAECPRCHGEGILPDLDLRVRVMVVLDLKVQADSASETEAREFIAGHVKTLTEHVENRLLKCADQLGFLPDGNREVLVTDDVDVDRVEIIDVAASRQDLAA